MPKNVTIRNLSRPEGPIITARYCNSFLCRLRGLMLRRELPANQGLLLVQKKDTVVDSSIHMLFMLVDLAVVWIDSSFHVVDVQWAKRWRLAYSPQKPARYVLEMSVECQNIFSVGDWLAFEFNQVT
jgi:uncharacterized membrane protein (UPF0127 family)